MEKVSDTGIPLHNLKILIRLPNWLGDVVMSAAFIHAVRELYPTALIAIIIKKELRPIATLIPGVDFIHTFSKQENKGLAGVFRFGKTLRKENNDLFFNLPESLSSLVLGWATGATKRIGFNKEGGFFLLTNAYKKPKNVHRVDEYLSLIEQLKGVSIGPKAVELTVKNKNTLKSEKVLVNFNSEADSRRMPVEKAITIINLLTNSFLNTTFTFIGSPKESAFIEQVLNGAENGDRIENFAGKTSLEELCNLISESKALLTTDSGPAHLANSIGIPVIVLFGAGNEHNTAPFNKQNLTVLRAGKLACEPCVKNTCELYGIPKCMQLINDLQIVSALNKYVSVDR